jgi:hypothetical protein
MQNILKIVHHFDLQPQTIHLKRYIVDLKH